MAHYFGGYGPWYKTCVPLSMIEALLLPDEPRNDVDGSDVSARGLRREGQFIAFLFTFKGLKLTSDLGKRVV